MRDTPYQCNNRKPFKEMIAVKDVEFCEHAAFPTLGAPVIREIPFVMSRSCQYTASELGKVDRGCDGCAWREDPIPV